MDVEFYRIQDDGVGVAGSDFLQIAESSVVPREFETVTIWQNEYTVDSVSWEVYNCSNCLVAKVYLRQIGR